MTVEAISSGSASNMGGSGGTKSSATIGGNAGAGGESSGGANGAIFAPNPELGISLSAGQGHTCVARWGLVYCWGDNRDGQLGCGDTAQRLTPQLVPGSSGVVQISTGEAHSCWLDDGGLVSCFGSNKSGQLGREELPGSLVPLRVALPGAAESIDVNYNHSCAVLKSGELYCWGENVETQLGQGDAPDENHFLPILVSAVDQVMAVGCGQGHTIALRSDGELYAWGRNTAGQVGLGEGLPTRLRVPTRLAGLGGFEKLDVGQDSACALRSGGALFCWGAGLDQHLGTQSDATVWTPVGVAVGPAWRMVSSDTFHTCAVDDQARLFCWGRAIEGQLGLGGFEPPQPEPTRVGDEWLTVSVGRFHTCAISLDQRIWCTGNNGGGELGLGDTLDRNVFEEVELP